MGAASAQPNVATDPSHACEDRLEDCPVWAASGECEENPSFMLQKCAHSCGSCDQLLHDCVPKGPDALKPGDIHAMFSRARTLARYSPTVLSADPWVLQYDSFLTTAEAAELIVAGGTRGFDRSRAGLHGEGLIEKRTSSTSWCNVKACEDNAVVRRVKARMLDILRMPEPNAEHLQTLRYEVGQFYAVHHDQNADPRSVWGPRVYTFFLYLSDVEEGGGTRFPRLNLTVTPRVGRALVWPSVYDHDVFEADMRTEHEAMPVLVGEKYAMNAWLHIREFVRPFLIGCNGSAVSEPSPEGESEAADGDLGGMSSAV
jgi:hypothetical protein